MATPLLAAAVRTKAGKVKLGLDLSPLPVSKREQEWMLFGLNQAAYLTRAR